MKYDRQLQPATETSWVVSYGGKTIPKWRTVAILKIDISISISEWKLIGFSWNFVYSSRFWTGWTSRDQKWKFPKLKMADGRHFENRYIAISQRKIIRFWWIFVHSSRFWNGWTSRDKKWKSCIGQTPSSTERIYCLQKYFLAEKTE